MSIIRKKFNNIELIFRELSESDEYFVSGVEIAKALGYENPEESERSIFSRNKALLEPYIILRQIDTKLSVGRPRVFRHYSEIGLYLFIMKSRTPIAEHLQVWMAKTLRQIRKERTRRINFAILKSVTKIEYQNRFLRRKVIEIESLLKPKSKNKKKGQRKDKMTYDMSILDFFGGDEQ